MAQCLFCKKEVKQKDSYVISVTTKSKIYFCNEFCYECYGPSTVEERILYMHLCDLSGVSSMTHDMFNWYRTEASKFNTATLNDLLKSKKAFLKRKANEQKAKGNMYMLKTALGIALKMYWKYAEQTRVECNTNDVIDEYNIELMSSMCCTYVNDRKRKNISGFL